MSSLFDDAHSDAHYVSVAEDGALRRERVLPSSTPAVATGAGQIVKCGGCGGAILARVALRIEVHPLPDGPLDAPAASSCRQAACVRAVAQDLAAEWAI